MRFPNKINPTIVPHLCNKSFVNYLHIRCQPNFPKTRTMPTERSLEETITALQRSSLLCHAVEKRYEERRRKHEEKVLVLSTFIKGFKLDCGAPVRVKEAMGEFERQVAGLEEELKEIEEELEMRRSVIFSEVFRSSRAARCPKKWK